MIGFETNVGANLVHKRHAYVDIVLKGLKCKIDSNSVAVVVFLQATDLKQRPEGRIYLAENSPSYTLVHHATPVVVLCKFPLINYLTFVT